MSRTIVITGGGTAGHIMPNLALLPLLEKEYDKIYYLGSKNSMEEKIIKDYKNITFIDIPTTKLVRKLTLKNLLIPFKLTNSICKTKKIIKKIKPDVIFCKGGFVSVPVAIAGKMCKIPVIAHESDFSMGLANKIILKFAKTVCTTFEDTALLSKKCVCTGTPIREQIYKGQKDKVLNKFNYAPQKPVVLFFGGSLGSKNINKLVEDSLSLLLEKYNIIHLTGKSNKAKKTNNSSNYYQVEFTNNIEDFFACADVVVCRGGANSLFELLALNKPMLIIPLSKAESRGDQLENADYFKKKGWAEVLQEEDMSPKALLNKLDYIIKNKASYNKARKLASTNSNKQIVEIIVRNNKK